MRNKEDLLTPKEVCDQYRISAPTLRKIVLQEGLPQRRFYDGGKILYRRADVERVLRSPKKQKNTKV